MYLLTIYTIVWFLVPWTLILASFMVGMLYNIGIALKILGYGFGGITVLFGGLVFWVWLVSETTQPLN